MAIVGTNSFMAEGFEDTFTDEIANEEANVWWGEEETFPSSLSTIDFFPCDGDVLGKEDAFLMNILLDTHFKENKLVEVLVVEATNGE